MSLIPHRVHNDNMFVFLLIRTYGGYILTRSNEVQQYAVVNLLQNYSTYFGRLSQPSSGVHQTVTAASGAGHSVRARTFRQRGLIRPR